jgi:hypothetical protein
MIVRPSKAAISFVYDGTLNGFIVEHTGFRYDKEFDIRDFGAIGDGTTDNTIAIQAALTVAGAAGPGTSVIVPQGIFEHTGTLIIPNFVTLRGMGIDVSRLRKSTFGDAIQSNCTINGSTPSYVRVERLTLENTQFPATPTWLASHAYTAGQSVLPTRYSPVALVCTQSGTSAAFEPIGQLSSGSTPSVTLTHSSAPAADHTVDILITSATMFQYSVDGAAFSADQTISPTVSIPGTVYTANFSGSYTTSALYKTPYPRWSLYPGTTITDGTCIWQVVKAGAGFNQTAGSFIAVEDVHVLQYMFGVIFDQSEVAYIGGFTSFQTRVGLWIVNSTANNTAAVGYLPQFSNRITVTDTVNFNGGIGLIDDGGTDHEFRGCNWANSTFQMVLAGVVGGEFVGGEYEGSTVAQPGYARLASVKLNGSSFFDRFAQPGQGPLIFHGGGSLAHPPGIYAFDCIDPNIGGTTCEGLSIHDMSISVGGGGVTTAIVGGTSLNGFHWGPNVICGLTPLDNSNGGGMFVTELTTNSPRSRGGLLMGGGLAGTQVPGALLHLAGGHANVILAWNNADVLANGANHNVTNQFQYSSLDIISVGTAGGGTINAPFNIDGFVAQVDGFEMEITNSTGQTLTLNHQNSGSTAANRIICPGGGDLVLPVVSGDISFAKLRYSGALSRWLVLTSSSASSSGGGSASIGPVDSLILANGNNNNVAIGPHVGQKITGPTTNATITGIVAGTNGQVVEIFGKDTATPGAGLFALALSSGSSSAANQIWRIGFNGAALQTVGLVYARLVYDSGNSKWVITDTVSWQHPSQNYDFQTFAPGSASITPHFDTTSFTTVGSGEFEVSVTAIVGAGTGVATDEIVFQLRRNGAADANSPLFVTPLSTINPGTLGCSASLSYIDKTGSAIGTTTTYGVQATNGAGRTITLQAYITVKELPGVVG